MIIASIKNTVNLEMTTKKEKQKLTVWKKYRVRI
ncbi:MAG: tail fiber assembly protein [Arsenophonus sp. NC-PG7-MAG3]